MVVQARSAGHRGCPFFTASQDGHRTGSPQKTLIQFFHARARPRPAARPASKFELWMREIWVRYDFRALRSDGFHAPTRCITRSASRQSQCAASACAQIAPAWRPDDSQHIAGEGWPDRQCRPLPVALRDRFPPPRPPGPLPCTICKAVPQRVWPAAYVATACLPCA